MIYRPDYISAITPFIDKPLVKILAGVRRCGKSTIFEMLREELLRRGVPEDRIIQKRYTEMDIPENITAQAMYDQLREAMEGKGKCYLLLDEIQEVKGWERAVNTLLEEGNADLYVTGSNSKLMSSEISTYLTGRFVSIPVYTLSPLRNIWTSRREVLCPGRSCWRSTSASAGSPSWRWPTMRRIRRIRSSTASTTRWCHGTS